MASLCAHRGAPLTYCIAHCKTKVLPSRVRCRASVKDPQQSSQQDTVSDTSASNAPGQPVKREFTALGSKVVETNVAFKGPEDQPDFWEGAQFDEFGKALENYFIPGLIALGLVCGGIAAKTYNEGATTFVKPPTGPDAGPAIILATPDGEPNISAPSILE